MWLNDGKYIPNQWLPNDFNRTSKIYWLINFYVFIQIDIKNIKEKFIFLFICRIDVEGNDICLNIIKKGTLGLGHCGFSRVFHAVQSNEDKQFLLYCLVITQLRVLFWNKVIDLSVLFLYKNQRCKCLHKKLTFLFLILFIV